MLSAAALHAYGSGKLTKETVKDLEVFLQSLPLSYAWEIWEDDSFEISLHLNYADYSYADWTLSGWLDGDTGESFKIVVYGSFPSFISSRQHSTDFHIEAALLTRALVVFAEEQGVKITEKLASLQDDK